MRRKNEKQLSEKETINSILALAKQQGVEEKVQNLIRKCEDNARGAKNEMEKKQIVALHLVEIYKTIGCVGGLIVDGVELIPPNPSYQEELNNFKNLVRLD
jgi:hypothetical protein